jgi:hypothetical protein
LMNLRNLAPVLQERILLPGDGDEIRNLNERTLRSIAGTPDWRKQIMAFEKLFRRQAAIPNK